MCDKSENIEGWHLEQKGTRREASELYLSGELNEMGPKIQMQRVTKRAYI